MKHAPLSGILALIVGLICGITTVAVLKLSDGKAVDQWRIQGHNVQPTVILSVLATLANALFRYAFDDAMRIRWWVLGLKGTSLGALHRSWEHAQSVLPILTSGKHMSLTAIASLSTLLLLIDGPLLQRSVQQRTTTNSVQTELSAPVSAFPFLQGATGVYADHDLSTHPTLYNPLFSKVLLQYNNRDPIQLPESGCRDQCEFDLMGPGFDIECHSFGTPYRLLSVDEYEKQQPCLIRLNATKNGTTHCPGPLNPQTMFSTNVTFSWAAIDLWFKLRSLQTGVNVNYTTFEGSDYYTPYTGPFPWNSIMLSSMVKSTLGSQGTLSWRYCVLREAVQRYPVTVTNDSVALRPRDVEQNNTEYLVLREEEDSGMQDWPSTLGGLWLSLSHAFSGTAKLQRSSAYVTLRTTDESPLVYVNYPNARDMNTDHVTWNDPIDDMISMVQELSLRTAIATTDHLPPSTQGIGPQDTYLLTAGQPNILLPNLTLVNRTLSQNVNASMTFSETVYESHFGWLAGSLAAMFLAFAAIFPLFSGWWHLGRAVSMSPIEIAKAFGAPIVMQTDSNGTARDLVNDIGKLQIGYGASATGFSASISEPKDPNIKRRLHFAPLDTIEVPGEQEKFM